jgi:polyhydroxyalkanoate synthesis regulator phasin
MNEQPIVEEVLAEAEQSVQELPLPEAGSSTHESQLADALGKLALASIGAVSLAGETAENWLRRFVARGEVEWQNARQHLDKLKSERPHLPRMSRPVVTIGTEKPALKSDLQALEQRLDALSAQLEDMAKQPPQGP